MPSQIHQKYCGYYSTLLSAQDLSLMGLGKTFEKDSMAGMGVAITDTQFARESKAKKRSHSQYSECDRLWRALRAIAQALKLRPLGHALRTLPERSVAYGQSHF
ncbi:hypothetical protein [Moorena sp. SIO3B2]|uniref:hypothetical protein n=1 Tax=Moorena sp. SIO3B2 TaxID=2607827 RepID=UPI0013C79E7A|nr:hypothetical protein [Moorena sp. SIO3B2]NEP35420.1 hypothetical protein [Moorena sp. SIO3B2]